MIRRSTLLAVEVVFGLVAALAIGLGVAWWQLSQGPIELNAIRYQMQTELSQARSGRPVGIERVELGLSPRGALELRAVGVTVEDGRGGVLSRSDEARVSLDVLPLLIGRISVSRAEFAGGAITFTRRPNGALYIAFGPEGAPPDIIIDPPPLHESLEQRVARVLDSMEGAFKPVGAGGSLRELSARGTQLTLIDEASGGRWTADAANIELARRGRSLALSADAELEGAEGVAPASLRITTDTRFQSAVIEFGAENARPRALFSQAALGPFAALDAPVTMNISVGLDRQAGVNRFEGDVIIGQGSAAMPGDNFNLSGGRLHGRYDVESDELIIDQISLAGDRTRVGGDIRVRDVSAIMRAAPNEPAAFNIALPSMRLEVPGTFEEPLAFSNVEVAGTIISGQRTINFTRLTARTGEGTFNGAGRLYWADVGGHSHLGLQLDGAVDGALEARDVLHMWPVGLGESAREYLARTITSGRVTDGTVRINITPADIADGVLTDEAVDVRFNISNAAMQFITTMSPVTNARGSGVLRGNRFDMTIPEARFHGMTITNGRIEAPQFKPRGGMMTISARADGDARQILEVLAMEPISLGDRLPIEATTATGRGSVNIRIQRPMVREAPFEAWRFNVDGSIRDFAGNMSTRRVALSQGQLTVRGDQRAVTVSGPIRAGASVIPNVRWTEHIGRTGANAASSSEYQISGDFDANDLERLGYPVARYAQGRIGVTVTGQGRGFDVDNARIDLDLRNAAVELPRGFWTKRSGQPASARFVVQRQSDGGLAFNDIDARGAGLTAQGRARLTRDNSVQEVDLPRLVIEGRSDARVHAVRAQDGALEVNVRGALFDAAPFMGSERSPTETATPVAAQTQAPANSGAMRASVIVDRLKMRGGATLADANVQITTVRNGLMTLSAEGRSPGGEAFSLTLGARAGDARSRVRFRAGDAGFAVRALTGAENVVGGTAAADGDWRGGAQSQARFGVQMRDFQVVRLPAMARLLSSAGSLTGLVEMLNGDGIGFNALEAQMTYANDRLQIAEGRMAGPSLGLTAAGNYDIARDNLDIDGVVAPSPMLNLSMLGSIPVIGDLLVSRRGEGVFGMTYSINGHAGEPRVGVNPVSALTPGILRRIFEPVPQREAEAPARGTNGIGMFDPLGSTPVAPDQSTPVPESAEAVADATP
ncbi:MAG: AsmA-like C-terminal region-containing protein [Terricaulis sp.]